MWTVVFLGITLVAIVMEVLAGLWHVAGTIPWTEYIAQYVPWPFQLIAYVALVVWLPFHFWRHDHMRQIAYKQGARFAELQAQRPVALALNQAVERGRKIERASWEEPLALIKYALHLRMYGENAPGGNETWAEFDQRAEEFLRGDPANGR